MADINVSAIISFIGVIVLLVNLIVEVLKNSLKNIIPTNILAVAVSMILTLVSFFALADIKGLSIEWYHISGAIVVGFMVSYASMFGYDKLKEIFDKITIMKGNK